VTAQTGGYFIPAGGTMPAAEPGYMSCVAEIARQRGGEFDFAHVVLAYGTGSTTTGVLLGLALAELAAQVWPVAIVARRTVEEIYKAPTPTRLAMESSAHFGLGLREADLPAHEIVYGYADEGYGVPNAASDAAMRLLASQEGYFLDTVYTAKAFAGLLGLRRSGRLPAGARVLFVHTGGLSMTPAGEKRYGG
jgi:1-aminocyclopropane-1-carboxylate deaminase/D-cysteine desulfhydrase-like pyridoxal-dependent ACC family enzyme